MNLLKAAGSIARIVGTVMAILVLSMGVFIWHELDWYPLNALAWHAQHGNVVRIGNFNIPVGFWGVPERRFGDSEVTVQLGHEAFPNVSFEVGRETTPASEMLEQLKKNANSSDPRVAQIAKDFLGMKRTTINVAGQPTVCMDNGVELRCIPQFDKLGLTVTSMLLPEDTIRFYALLGKVTRAQAK